MESSERFIARPAFLFRAKLRLPGETSLDRRYGQPRRPAGPTPPRWLLLAPRRHSLDYAQYTIEPASLAQKVAKGAYPLDELVTCLEGWGAVKAESQDASIKSIECRRYACVPGGAFFALHDSMRYPLRVMAGTPLIYLNENRKEILIEDPQEVVRIEVGYRLSLEAYAVLRRRIAGMRVPLAAAVRDETQTELDQLLRHPGHLSDISAAIEPPPAKTDRLNRGMPKAPGGPPPKGRFAKGRPISHPPYEPPRR
jgi:hypothetical protein